MDRQRHFIVVFVVVLAAGCTTHLATRPGLPPAALQSDPLDAEKGKLQLLSYSVPAAQFKIAIKYRPATCMLGAVGKSELQATIETQYNAAERYSIDYSALAAFTKITTISTGLYPNGTLKLINAEASDQTIETATAVIKFVASVAALAGKQAGFTEDPRCSAWTKRVALEAPLKAAQEQIDAQVTALLTAPATVDSAEATGKSVESLSKLRDVIAGKITALEGSGWTTNDAIWPATPTTPVRLNEAQPIQAGYSDHLYVVLKRLEQPTTGKEAFAAPPTDVGSFDGLVWRRGYMAKLELIWCGDGLSDADVPLPASVDCPLDTAKARPSGLVVASVTAQTPQAGPFFVIPLHNGIGRNNTIAATFLQDGTIETAGYGDKVATGSHIANAASDAATAAAALKAPSLTTKLGTRKACLDAVDGLRKSEAATADVLGGSATDQTKLASYAASCMQ